ncbi:hypothetical protein C8Q74DRAFT_1366134 [Fomes fomentarius]|nr:hypothetical protein C8Q74DRAFT_1366134 [Fomes fomentarius]
MNQCPAELLSYIFADACTDDGQTGRALALVSRRIRSISRPYALQSVALYGSHQIAAFAAHLAQLSADERRVRNLYLTDRRRVWMEYRPGQARTEWLRERITEEFHVIDPSREYSANPILRILEYVAPTVRICTFLFFDRYSEQALRMPFVALEELSLYGSLLDLNGYPQVPLCPRLRRLHFVQDLSAVKSITRAIAHTAPNLTHLRLSRLVPSAASAGDVVRGLEQMIQQKDGTPSQCGFPPTLQRVIIQIASQQEMRDVSGTLNLLTSPVIRQLKDIMARDTRKRIIVTKPPPGDAADCFAMQDMDVEFYMGIKAHWEQRIVGREGAWEVHASEVLSLCEQGEVQDESCE